MNLFPNVRTLLVKLSVPALQFTIEHKFTIVGFTNTRSLYILDIILYYFISKFFYSIFLSCVRCQEIRTGKRTRRRRAGELSAAGWALVRTEAGGLGIKYTLKI